MAPEYLVLAACRELLAANEAWKVLHPKSCPEDPSEGCPEDLSNWTLTHIYYANMGGFVLESTPNEKLNYYTALHLTFNDIYSLREDDILPKLRDIPAEEIDNKSKGDGLVKAIAVMQITWSTAQIIVRAFRKLSVSPLEVAVVAFAFCAIVIYGLYWKKPQRATATITVERQVV
ncbi:hypothetical protein ACHAQJ_006680 [Trichoderma viride]